VSRDFCFYRAADLVGAVYLITNAADEKVSALPSYEQPLHGFEGCDWRSERSR
jgi:hypothetical protein